MIRALIRHLRLAVAYTALGALLAAGLLLLHFLRADPRPAPWHEIVLQEEFTARRVDEIRTVADYHALEERLQREIEERIRSRVAPADRLRFNRYTPGSASDPQRWPVNWNLTFEFHISQPRGGALLLHGLTDSPYSLRFIGQALNEDGLEVVGLRLPGHGTVPSGLTSFSIEDMRAAVSLAARDIARRLEPGQPLYLVGYSNGAALAVDYCLAALEGVAELPPVAGLVLISPSLGVHPLAVLGRIRTGISALPGFEKLAWQVITPEYDPFKYGSFPWNAAGQVHRLTRSISSRIERLDRDDRIAGFPPTLVLLSTVDATVRAEAVVDVLLAHLRPGRHELVLFDVNRRAEATELLIRDPAPLTARLLGLPTRPYALTVVTNERPDSSEVIALQSPAGGGLPIRQPVGLSWPDGVLSLSHVALPFPADDPLYGYVPGRGDSPIHLGRVELRAEMGVLAVPQTLLVRMRSNPFYPWMEQRIRAFLGG